MRCGIVQHVNEFGTFGTPLIMVTNTGTGNGTCYSALQSICIKFMSVNACTCACKFKDPASFIRFFQKI